MKLSIPYPGSQNAFEGDRTLWLRTLPVGARVNKATVVLNPSERSAGVEFTEVIDFSKDPQTWWGATCPVVVSTSPAFVEVDFHARRTLASVTGVGTGLTLQVDLGGGAYAAIADDGSFFVPGGTELTVTMTAAPASTVGLPGLKVNKFKLSKPVLAAGETIDVTAVTIRTVPTNLSVKLGQMPAFWNVLGEVTSEQVSPDFKDILNAFLLSAEVENGFYAVPFVVHSDAIARLDVTVELDFVLTQDVLPPHLPEITIPYNYSTLPGVDENLTTVKLPSGATPISANAQVRGEFGATRIVWGPIGYEPPTIPVIVSSEVSVAQPIRFDHEMAVTCIDLPLGNTAPGLGGMNLSIQADSDGKPFGDVLIQAEVKVDKPLPGQTAWGSAALPRPFRVLPGERYWLILQSLDSNAFWEATADSSTTEPTLQCSRDGGMSWRALAGQNLLPQISALFRLRNQPEHFSIPIQLQIGKGMDAVRRKLDEFAPLGRTEFNFDFAGKLGEFLQSPSAQPPCGDDDLLMNGDFESPAFDDATRLLLGFVGPYKSGTAENESDGEILGRIKLPAHLDLSVQKYIRLARRDVGAEVWQTPRIIDCSGAIPERTTPDEVVSTIQRVMGTNAARLTTHDTDPEDEEGLLRLFVDPDDAHLLVDGWCRSGAPLGWQLESGHVAQIGLPDSDDIAIQLGQPNSMLHPRLGICVNQSNLTTTELTQDFSVHEGCAYLLRLRYQWENFVPDDDDDDDGGDDIPVVLAVSLPMSTATAPALRWEVRWRDANNQMIRTDEALVSEFSHTIGASSPLQNYETRIAAPEKAVSAQLAIIQDDHLVVMVGDQVSYDGTQSVALAAVSLMPTREMLMNGGFLTVDLKNAEEPVSGWLLKSGGLDSVDGHLILAGSAGSSALAQDTVLSQKTAVSAGQDYELSLDVISRPLAASSAAARLEIAWLNASDQTIGTLFNVALGADSFPIRYALATAPAGAVSAEVRLIQPKGQGSLQVNSISLMVVERVDAPLIFLGETPGQLTISNLRVTYDLPEPVILSKLESAAPTAADMMPVPAQLADVHAEAFALKVEALPVARAPAIRLRPSAALAQHDVEMVAGVSTRLLTALKKEIKGQMTIADLAALQLTQKSLPGTRGTEWLDLKTRAEMILDLRISADAFTGLNDTSLEDLIWMPPEDVAQQSGQSVDGAKTLQRELRMLRLLLKNDAFRSMTLAELV